MFKCPICDSNEIKKKFNDDRYHYSIYKCRRCRLLFKDTKEIINYESLDIDAYKIYDFSRKSEVEEIIKIIKHCYSSDNFSKISILEIGSGSGSLLNEFRSFGFKNLYGVEPSKVACEYSINAYNINVINGYFNREIIKEKCDIILLYDVLEHLLNPHELIEEISKYMEKSTLLIIKTGDNNSINANILPREWQYFKSSQHIRFYNKTSISELLNKYNIRIVRFYVFKHAYGGLHIGLLLRNIIFSLIVRFLFKIKLYVNSKNSYGIPLANDHFIVLCKKTD